MKAIGTVLKKNAQISAQTGHMATIPPTHVLPANLLVSLAEILVPSVWHASKTTTSMKGNAYQNARINITLRRRSLTKQLTNPSWLAVSVSHLAWSVFLLWSANLAHITICSKPAVCLSALRKVTMKIKRIGSVLLAIKGAWLAKWKEYARPARTPAVASYRETALKSALMGYTTLSTATFLWMMELTEKSIHVGV